MDERAHYDVWAPEMADGRSKASADRGLMVASAHVSSPPPSWEGIGARQLIAMETSTFDFSFNSPYMLYRIITIYGIF